MDFKTTEEAADLGGLGAHDHRNPCARPERPRELDGLEQRFDANLWAKLVEADVLSAAALESVGGGGLGVLEQAAVLTALGRQLSAVPYLDSVVLGAGALAAFGSEELRTEWAAPAVAGDKILAVALDGEMGQGPVQAQTDGAAYKLTGSRTQVNYGPIADAFLVPAETDSGTVVFLVSGDDPGVTVSVLSTTGKGSVAHLELEGTPVDAARVVGGAEVAAWLTTHSALGRSAFQLGVLERALELTSEYAREREQFDRPIGSFQAVSSRLADGYIDVKGLRLTLTQAAWRLSEDLPADIDVRQRGVLGGRGRPSRRAHRRPRARRRRHRHGPPCAPVLPGRQADRVRCRRGGRSSSCCASAANSPTPRSRDGGPTVNPTVTELLVPLVEVTDCGLYQEDSFVEAGPTIWPPVPNWPQRRKRLDASKPPHVGALLGNTTFFSSLLVAAELSGLVPVGLHQTRRGEALARDIAKADCQLVLADSSVARGATGVDYIDVESADWAAEPASSGFLVTFADLSAEDLFVLIFTSGTSGDPKAVRVTHDKVAFPGRMLADRFGWVRPTRLPVDAAVPLQRDHGGVGRRERSRRVDRACAASSPRSRFMPDIRRFGATCANYVGKPLSYNLATEPAPDDADNPLRDPLRQRGSPMDPELFAERFGVTVVDWFRSTEGGVAIARTPETPKVRSGRSPPGHHRRCRRLASRVRPAWSANW